ncbi:MAG TPA: aliphatic sulfonate ABC transporter substrate-binding protein [Desulfuromonadaceae bacterium]|jgi:sulfonate transport system substrate-binding protein
MKRTLFKGLMLFIFVLSPVLSQAADAKKGDFPAKKKPIYADLKTINLSGQTSANFIPFWIAKNKGWFEEEFGKEGIKVNYSIFKSGPLLLESFASGEQHIGIVGDTPAIIGHTQGIKLKAIGVIGHGPKRLAILVPPNSSIKSAKELKGKRIATAKGSTAHELLALVLKEQGLGWNDVKVVNLQPGDAVIALKTGDVDAASIWEPTVSEAVLNGIGKILLDGTGYKLGLSLIIVNSEFAAKYPDLAVRYLKVIKRASDWRKKHARETVEILAKETKYSGEVLKAALPKIITDVRITDKTFADLKKSATQLRESEVLKKDADIDALVDTQYLEKAKLQ